jgi:hypothetical protein
MTTQPNASGITKQDCWEMIRKISNANSGASQRVYIILALYFYALITFLGKGGISMYMTIHSQLDKCSSLYSTIFCVLSIASIFFFAVGLYFFYKVITPILGQIGPHQKHICNRFGYLGDLIDLKPYDFHTTLTNMDEEEFIRELTEQIVAQSQRHNYKFTNIKKGLEFATLGFVLFVVVFLLGYLYCYHVS